MRGKYKIGITIYNQKNILLVGFMTRVLVIVHHRSVMHIIPLPLFPPKTLRFLAYKQFESFCNDRNRAFTH